MDAGGRKAHPTHGRGCGHPAASGGACKLARLPAKGCLQPRGHLIGSGSHCTSTPALLFPPPPLSHRQETISILHSLKIFQKSGGNHNSTSEGHRHFVPNPEHPGWGRVCKNIFFPQYKLGHLPSPAGNTQCAWLGNLHGARSPRVALGDRAGPQADPVCFLIEEDRVTFSIFS